MSRVKPFLVLVVVALALGGTIAPTHAQDGTATLTATFADTETEFSYDAAWDLAQDETFATLTNGDMVLAVMDYPFVEVLAPDTNSLAEIAAAIVALDETATFDPDLAQLDVVNDQLVLTYATDSDTDQIYVAVVRFENGAAGALLLYATPNDNGDDLLATFLAGFESSTPIETGECVAVTGADAVAAYLGPDATSEPIAEVPAADGALLDGILTLDDGAVWWLLAESDPRAWVDGATVGVRGDCSALAVYELPPSDTFASAQSEVAVPIGDLWNVTFGSLSASCSDDTESAYIAETLAPTTVAIAITDDGMRFGETVLTEFAPNRYEGFLLLDAEGETQIARIFVETITADGYLGELTLNFNDNTCSATIAMTLTRSIAE